MGVTDPPNPVVPTCNYTFKCIRWREYYDNNGHVIGVECLKGICLQGNWVCKKWKGLLCLEWVLAKIENPAPPGGSLPPGGLLPPNLPPPLPAVIPSFSYSVLLEGNVQFYNTTLGLALKYKWEFGDGYISYLKNPEHKYSSPGLYNVVLKAYKSLTSYETLIAGINVDILTQSADFTYIIGGFTVWFTDTSTSLKYEPRTWVFGDGHTLKTSSLEFYHTFPGNGRYEVKLYVGGFIKTAIIIIDTEILLTWDDNSDNEDGFIIEHSLDGVSNWLQIAVTGPNINSYGITFATTGIDSTVLNYFRVKANNESGDSDNSNIASCNCGVI